MAGFIYKLQNIVNTSPDSDDTNINIARCILKNIDKQKVLKLKEEVAYQKGQVVSKTLAQNEALSVTFFFW